MRSALTVWVASDSERIAHIYSYDGSAFIVALERMKPPVLEWIINAATLDAATSAAECDRSHALLLATTAETATLAIVAFALRNTLLTPCVDPTAGC